VGKNNWRDPGVAGRIILEWIFRKWDVGLWTGLGWLRIQTEVSTCESGDEPSDLIKRGKFHD
jgi:hypothetical protein